LSVIDAELLEILVCPETHQPVRLADDALIARVNAAVSAGSLKNRAGAVVDTVLESGLVRDDGRVLYPVRDGIPVMLLDEAIELDAVDAPTDPDSPTS
jgi:uncharacterized protein YbaR (Trm112 family)